ncbi:MAG: hypothetical protein KGL42_06685 [Betaproteobacteria bacterium]|nr:hypothetical protein [Betaproteobacteria bacterium]
MEDINPEFALPDGAVVLRVNKGVSPTWKNNPRLSHRLHAHAGGPKAERVTVNKRSMATGHGALGE